MTTTTNSDLTVSSAPGQTTAAVSLQRLNQFSPEQMEEVIKSTQTEHLQLSRGQFNGQLLRGSAGGKVVDTGVYNQSIIGWGGMCSQRVTLGMVMPLQKGGVLDGTPIDFPSPFLYTEGGELHTRLEAGTRWLCFQVDRAELEDCGLFLPQVYAGTLRCDSENLQILDSEVRRVLRNLAIASAPELREGMDDLLTAFANALPPCETSSSAAIPLAQRRLVPLVQDYIESHLAGEILIRSLCTRFSVSYKTLERAFNAVLGVSPRRYLSIRRLSRARQLLLSEKFERGRVAHIAANCGISELGRFSRDYRYLFGETPSQTLSMENSCIRS